jgi:hypothetical protein
MLILNEIELQEFLDGYDNCDLEAAIESHKKWIEQNPTIGYAKQELAALEKRWEKVKWIYG